MKIVRRLAGSADTGKLKSRETIGLDVDEIKTYCEFSGLVEILLNRADRSRKIYRWWHDRTADRFGRRVARLAVRECADAVIMYDTTAASCFEYLNSRVPHIKRIMDSSLANRLYLREIYRDEADAWPAYSNRIHSQWDYLWDEGYANRLRAELAAADYYLAPSKFVAKSLEFSGVVPSQIKLCPYGTNFEVMKAAEKSNPEKLQVLFVGVMTERKGIQYLLKAAEVLADQIEVTLVGAYNNSDHVFDSYLDLCNFVGAVPHDEVQRYMQQADVFVFPSLGEGMSLSVLEAMACGLPCIVSANSGANDAIEEGVNGFVVEAQSVDALVEKILWCTENRSKLPQMGDAARRTAKEYSWEAYGDRLAMIMTDIIENGVVA